jgi:hypothetical protein
VIASYECVTEEANSIKRVQSRSVETRSVLTLRAGRFDEGNRMSRFPRENEQAEFLPLKIISIGR